MIRYAWGGGGLLALALGTTVMLGWVLQDARLVQLAPGWAPMQFNTALCFALLGLAQMCVRGPVLVTGSLLAFLAACIAAATLLQYALQVDFGLDQLLMQHDIVQGTSHPGRMAPNTSICFMLVAASIMAHDLSEQTPLFGTMDAIAIVATLMLSAAALAGYAFGVQAAYGWAGFTQMAAHTAAGLFVLATVRAFNYWRRVDLHPNPVINWLPPIVFAALLILGCALTASGVGQQQASNRAGMLHAADVTVDSVEKQLAGVYSALLRIADRWSATGGTPPALWERDAGNYLADIPSLNFVAWLNADLQVQRVVGDAAAARLAAAAARSVADRRESASGVAVIPAPAHPKHNALAVLIPTRGNGPDNPPGFVLSQVELGALTAERMPEYEGGIGRVRLARPGVANARALRVGSATVPVVTVGRSSGGGPNQVARESWLTFVAGLLGALLVSALVGALLQARRFVRETRRSAAALEQEVRTRASLQDRLRLALDLAQVGSWYWAGKATFELDEGLRQLLGTDQATMSLPAFAQFIHPEDRPGFMAHCRDGLRSIDGAKIEYRLIGTDGTVHHVESAHTAERLASGRVASATGVIRDITAQRTLERQLREQADTDALTGLHNRGYFSNELQQECARARRSNAALSLLMIDIDHFKRLNDASGHVAGDGVLIDVAKAIEGCVRRPPDTVARYGGEEFAVILPDTDGSGAVTVADKIRDAIRGCAISHPDSPLGPDVTVSIGAAQFKPADHRNPDAFVTTADNALYAAKEQGRDRVIRAQQAEPAEPAGPAGPDAPIVV